MSWTLTYSTTVVTLPDPKSYEASEEKAQALDFTAANSPRAYDKGDVTTVSLYRLRVVWEDLDSDDKYHLQTLFHYRPTDGTKGVHGVMNTFTLAVHNGNTYTARFAEPTLKFETAGTANRWNITVELLTDNLVST